MIVLLMSFLLSLAGASAVAQLSRVSARLAGPGLPEVALLRIAMKGAMVATMGAMYAGYRLTDGNPWSAILAVAAGVLVMLAIWEKRRRLLLRRRAGKAGDMR